MKKNIILSIVTLIILGGFGAALLLKYGVRGVHSTEAINTSSITLKLNGKKITAELARTPDELQKGLSGRKSLGENRGMFFDMGKPDIYSFWMKDMNFPIDIIWLDRELKIVDMTKSIAPETFPKTFSPKVPSYFVLEVPAGSSDKWGVKVGNTVNIVSK